MVSAWHNMIAAGWTPDKTYLEASQNSAVQVGLPDGKVVCIPPTYGMGSKVIPIIIPRQVASQGHTHFFVELCDLCTVPGEAPKLKHLAGSTAVTEMLQFMHRHGKSIKP